MTKKHPKGFKKDDDSYLGFETIVQRGKKIKTGRIHPEIGELRRKYLLKDLKIFEQIQGHDFCRGYYKGELDVYPEKAFAHLPEGKKSCIGMHCYAVGQETRAVFPIDAKQLEEKTKGEKNEHNWPCLILTDEEDEIEQIIINRVQLNQ